MSQQFSVHQIRLGVGRVPLPSRAPRALYHWRESIHVLFAPIQLLLFLTLHAGAGCLAIFGQDANVH